MNKPRRARLFSFTPVVAATADKVTVRLGCDSDPAMDQTWTYMRAGLDLKLISVASPDGSEIEHDPTLRGRARRLAVAAWTKATVGA